MVVSITCAKLFKTKILASPGKLVVVDWFAKWCTPCKKISPFIETLSNNNPDVKFYKVDVDELPELSQQENVASMPTFTFYRNGQKIDSFSGADEETLKAKVEEHKNVTYFVFMNI